MSRSTATVARMLALTLALPLLLAACGSGSYGDREGGAPQPAGTPPPALPEAVQLDPPGSDRRLTAEETERVVSTALAEPEVASAVREGTVARVLVRAAPGGGPGGTVAFLFASPVEPGRRHFEVLCDIGGQTPDWRGVAARVALPAGDVEGSPIWRTGANCVGMDVPG